MPSLFLHRISVVHVYLYIAATTADSAGRDLRHQTITFIILFKEFLFGFMYTFSILFSHYWFLQITLVWVQFLSLKNILTWFFQQRYVSHKIFHSLFGKKYLHLTLFLNNIGIKYEICGYRIVGWQLFSLNILQILFFFVFMLQLRGLLSTSAALLCI